MVKYSILFLFASVVVYLGLASPAVNFSDPQRDPVPPSQKVAHSIHCSGCHGFDESGLALIDDDGNDVNIYDDWHISMMALSSHDPFWRATLKHEVSLFPGHQNAIETTCLKCHAPLGSNQAHWDNRPYTYHEMLADSLGLDGVSCSSCHQQSPAGLGSGHTGNLNLDTNRIMFGPYPNPFKGPMQLYVGFEPVFSDHIYTSELCAGCHTLITSTLDENGNATGGSFIEQATYHEWINSVYSLQGKECQSCHMPFIQDSVVIATDFSVLKKRHPFGLHQFFGANTAMLTMMKENRKDLGIRQGTDNFSWDQSIDNNRISLQRSAQIEVTSMNIFNDTLDIDVVVKNNAGHKLPSGYPSRVVWLQVVLTGTTSTDTIFASGILEEGGHIKGRDLPFEDHHQVITAEDQVQIYEMVMSNSHGDLTTSLNAAATPLKDNRLLPVGFKKDHPVYDTTSVWGTALEDDQYGVESQKGEDRIQYKIALNGKKGTGDLSISLHYHTFPKRWLNDIFTSDSIAEVATFKNLYQGYEDKDELLYELQLNDIPLWNTSSMDPVSSYAIAVFPNPVARQLNLSINPSPNVQLSYRITNFQGQLMQEGKVTSPILLNEKIKPGLFYIMLYEKTRLVKVLPITVL